MYSAALAFLFTHESFTFQQIPKNAKEGKREAATTATEKLLLKLCDDGECR